MILDGKSLSEVLAAKLTSPYDAKVPGGLATMPASLGTSADRLVGALYVEATRG
jgi:cyclase